MVGEAAAAGDPRRVEKGPVARETLVGEDPVLADALELGMHPGDLAVPRDADQGIVAAPDRDPGPFRLERYEPLALSVVKVDEERRTGAGGFNARL